MAAFFIVAFFEAARFLPAVVRQCAPGAAEIVQTSGRDHT